MGKTNFDLIARFYPLLEQIVFGSTLNMARRFFIPRVTEGNKILLIGEGNGRFLFETMKETSPASVTVVDSSARMLAAAARRIATVNRSSRIELIHADILEWRSPAAHYDRIVTHFSLDLFPRYRIRRIVEKISRLATEDTLWINVDFTSENQRLRQKLLMWANTASSEYPRESKRLGSSTRVTIYDRLAGKYWKRDHWTRDGFQRISCSEGIGDHLRESR
jgi:ubiquinone/menaquinone biosynthesis C-methylase UbiE